MIIFLLTLIFACLAAIVVGGALMWRKVNLYLTWNTRNDSLEYEKAIATPKFTKPAGKPSKVTQRGRALKQADELVDLEDMLLEDAVTAIESI